MFDLFHAGHIEALERAKEYGDILIVGILSDEDTFSYKRKPIIPYDQRLKILQNISIIDKVIPGPKIEFEEFYRTHKIDIHCQGDQLDGFYETARRLGILRILGRSQLNETTQIIQKIVNLQ